MYLNYGKQRTIAYLVTFKFTVRRYFRFLPDASQLVIASRSGHFEPGLFFRLGAYSLSLVPTGWLWPCPIQMLLLKLCFWYFYVATFDDAYVLRFCWMGVNWLGKVQVMCGIGCYRPSAVFWFHIVVRWRLVEVFSTWKTNKSPFITNFIERESIIEQDWIWVRMKKSDLIRWFIPAYHKKVINIKRKLIFGISKPLANI